MKRICCFCESWESGGIESFLASVYTHADLSELEIDIVTSKLLDSVFTARLEKLGIRFYQLSGSQRRLLTNHAMFRRLLRERHYDVLHINAFQSLSLYYAKLAMQAGVPVRIAHSHNTALRKSPLRWAKMLLHRMGRQYLGHYATALWACSRDAANFLFSQRDLAARGYTFIPNGIALSRFRFDPKQREAARAELGCSDGVLIGNVGRLCYQKNQEFLLDILPAILTREPRARLLLVGEGADEEKLRSRAAALNIADRVIFYGVTGGVERLLWAMDVFAFPSRFEGLGIVAIEAQTAGLPVVCSEHIPIEALLSPETRQVPLSDAAGWAEALLTAAASETTRDSGPEVCQRFSIDAVAAMIASYYKGEQP